MKRLEQIILMLTALGMIMKLAMISGGSVITGVLLSILAIIYYVFGFALFNNIRIRQILKRQAYQGISVRRIIGAICTGIALSIIIIGIQYKLLHLPGAQIMLYIGLACTIVILVIAIVMSLKSKASSYSMIFSRIIIIGGVGALFAFLPELTLVKIEFRNHPDYIKAYEAHLKDPQNEELRQKRDREYMRAKMTAEEFERYMKNHSTHLED